MGATRPAKKATTLLAPIFFAEYRQIGMDIPHSISKTIVSIFY